MVVISKYLKIGSKTFLRDHSILKALTLQNFMKFLQNLWLF